MPVGRNINSPSSNAKSRRDGGAAAASVAATKKRPSASRLPLTCRCSVAQSSFEMLYLLQSAASHRYHAETAELQSLRAVAQHDWYGVIGAANADACGDDESSAHGW